jgi:hypothetical protein
MNKKSKKKYNTCRKVKDSQLKTRKFDSIIKQNKIRTRKTDCFIMKSLIATELFAFDGN